jgi:hypothetical protein
LCYFCRYFKCFEQGECHEKKDRSD